MEIKKPHPKVSIRKEFYETCDKVYLLKDVTVKLEDKQLQSLATELEELLTKIEDRLDEKYSWD